MAIFRSLSAIADLFKDLVQGGKAWHSSNDGAGSGLDSDLIRGLPADFTSSKDSDGYQKLPSGIIVQWGETQYDGGDGNNGTLFNFPIAFPNDCFIVMSSDNTSASMSTASTSYSNTQGVCWAKDSNGTYPQDARMFWIAIGY